MLLRRLDARRPVDQRLGVQVEVVLVRVGGADVTHHPVRVAPQRVLEVDRPVELLGRPGEERGHVGVLLPRHREAEVVAVLRLEVLLVLRVVEQILAIHPDLIVAVQRDRVVAAGVLVLHRHGSFAAGEILIPVRLVLGDERVEITGEPGLGVVAVVLDRGDEDLVRPVPCRDRLEVLRDLVGRGNRRQVELDVRLFEELVGHARRALREGDAELTGRAVPHAHLEIETPLAVVRELLQPEDGPAGRGVRAVLVPLGAGEARGPADHALRQLLVREDRVPRRRRPGLRGACEPTDGNAGACDARGLQQLSAREGTAIRLIRAGGLTVQLLVFHALLLDLEQL